MFKDIDASWGVLATEEGYFQFEKMVNLTGWLCLYVKGFVMGSRLVRFGLSVGLAVGMVFMGSVPAAFSDEELVADPIFVSVSAGYGHSLAVDALGRVWAWGNNAYGQLGNGTSGSSADVSRPVLVDDAATGTPDGLFGDHVKVVSVSAGYGHSLAIDALGRVWAWGYNGYGQLGNGTSGADVSRPMLADDATTGDADGLFGDHVMVVSVVAGYYHSLAVDADGRVWAWGYNGYGQLGNGTNGSGVYMSRPALADDATTDVDGLFGNGVRVVSVAAGYQHSLAVDALGRVWAWGLNNYGQLGNGSSNNMSRPMLADDATTGDADGLFGNGVKVVSVAAGNSHSLAVDALGRVWAWGMNNYGQLGNGSSTAKSRPVLADTATDADGLFGNGVKVVSVSAGSYHSSAVDALGRVWAWGWNEYGQLGNGTNGDGVYESRPVLADDATDVDGLFGAGVLIKSVTAGYYHSLAVDKQGRVWAWGDNYNGQVGNGTKGDGTARSRPVSIEITAPTVSIPAGVCIVASLSGSPVGGYSAAADVTYTWKDTAANPNDPPLQSGSSNMFVPTASDVGKKITVTASGTAWNWQALNTTSEQFDVTTATLVPVSGSVIVGGVGVVGVPVSVKKTGTNTVLGSTTTDSNGGFSFGCSVWDAAGWDVVFTNTAAPVSGVVSASSRQFDTTNVSLSVASDHSSASLSGIATDAGTGLEITMVAPFKVEFDTGTTDVTNPVSQFMFSDGKVVEPDEPSQVGYEFDGWWTTKNYTTNTEWDFDDSVSESMTLYAKWVEKTDYTVNYNLNYVGAASGGSRTNVAWTATNLLPTSNPVRTGYRFIGWTIDSAASSTEVSATTAYAVLAGGVEKSLVTVFAQWSTVNVDTDGDGEPDLNVDTDGDGEPDINIDTDGDGIPDMNVLYRLLGDDEFGVFTGNGVRSVSVDAPYNKFVKLLLADTVVAASDYVVTEGSTVITLQESYLKTLTNGTYWFAAIFTNGESERIELIVDVPEVHVPTGGRTVTTTTSLLLTITSFGMLCILAGYKRRLQQTH
jgi:uncharacterized repeat protein (TIGR02543 family)